MANGFVLKLRGEPTGRREYACPSHGPFDLVVDLATSRDPRPCPECGAPSERTLTQNVYTYVDPLSFNRGKSDPPPSPYAMDTRPLAEGMPLKEWKAQRKKLWRGRDHDRAKAKGLI